MLVADMFDLDCPNLEIADVGAPGAASLMPFIKDSFQQCSKAEPDGWR